MKNLLLSSFYPLLFPMGTGTEHRAQRMPITPPLTHILSSALYSGTGVGQFLWGWRISLICFLLIPPGLRIHRQRL